MTNLIASIFLFKFLKFWCQKKILFFFHYLWWLLKKIYHLEDINENMTSYGNHNKDYTIGYYRPLQHNYTIFHASKRFHRLNWNLTPNISWLMTLNKKKTHSEKSDNAPLIGEALKQTMWWLPRCRLKHLIRAMC